MRADGRVVIEANMDTSTAERDLAELKARIEKLESSIKSDTETKTGLEERSKQLSATLDSAKAKLYEMQTAAKGAFAKEEIAEQKEYVKGLQSEWDDVTSAAERYGKNINSAKTQLEGMKAQAGELEAKIDAANSPMGKLSASAAEAEKRFSKLKERIKSLAMSALVFSVITQGLNAFKTWMGKVLQINTDAQASFARLKGALLTLAQPLVEIMVPVLTILADILTVIVSKVAAFISALSGKSVKQSADAAQSLYNQTESLGDAAGSAADGYDKEAKAIGRAGNAAKKASQNFASFDEINVLGSVDQSGTENINTPGLGTGMDATMPDFTLDASIPDKLKEIADLVMLIGAGLGLWKLGSVLPGALGDVSTILGGILLTVGGLLLAWNGLSDAWENGFDWGTLIESIGGVAAAATGLYLIFGKIGAGIALIVGGIALLITAFHDAMENGWSLKNALGAIAGLLMAGLGISLLVGSFIPLLIAAIASVLLALTVATGHGGELIAGIRKVLEGFKDFFVGIFTGDINRAIKGIGEIIDGLKDIVFAVLDGCRDTILGFLDWLDEKTGGRLHGIIEFIRGLISGLFSFVKLTLGGILDAVKQILEGVIEFISGVFAGDWDKAWAGIKKIFSGVWNGIIGTLESAINAIIKGINWLVSQMNKISFDVPDWVPGIGGKTLGVNIPSISYVSIPRLAQGAVIPPNREFAAVLGDQKSGMNLEAPEALIRRIVREESGRNNTPKTITVIMECDRIQFGKVVYTLNNEEVQRVGVNLAEAAHG